MIALNTERLTLIPLNADNLKLLIDHQNGLAAALSLSNSEVFLDEELRHALKFRLSKLLADEYNYLWHTNWLIVSKEKNCTVGGIMMKGLPNDKGEVVIGYYTFVPYQGNGYMTETNNTMKNWLLSQPDVMFVIADTEKDNLASHKVLGKAGAQLFTETEELYFWRFF
ncbi:GNAT family N-acetyltransferase [Lysinibacillus parviboronicapiens]|uniref:GNAT family N-acetyltransferase n=1 Tax=Lysinibacillus parviboronicapiens TaxID=436516 RepID=UPI000D351FE6|nr:GNAT family N-acetyltransferase [Lysinibacillus parviboronicapiens]